MDRKLETKTGAVCPDAAIIDVARETLLAAIEIDRGNALAGFHQGNRDMQSGGGFTRATLLVAEHNDVTGAGLPLASLHQHAPSPREYLQITHDRGQVKCALALSNRNSGRLYDESLAPRGAPAIACNDSAAAIKAGLSRRGAALLGGMGSGLIRAASCRHCRHLLPA